MNNIYSKRVDLKFQSVVQKAIIEILLLTKNIIVKTERENDSIYNNDDCYLKNSNRNI